MPAMPNGAARAARLRSALGPAGAGGFSAAHALRELAWPTQRWWLALHALIAARALLYWYQSIGNGPDVPLSVHALYRPLGDIQYFPLITAFARLNFGEAAYSEHQRTGISSFSPAGMLPHVFGYGITQHPIGFAVGDLIATFGYFLALGLFLWTCGVSLATARCVAVLTTVGVVSQLSLLVTNLHLWPPQLFIWVWGERLPRPLVSEIYVLLAWGLLLQVARTPPAEQRPRRWVFAGVALSLSVQSDVHSAVTFALLLVAIVALTLWDRRGIDRDFVRCWLWFAASFIVVAGLFAVQQALIHPDVARRLGVFPIPRLHPLFEVGEVARAFAVVVFGVCTMAVAPMLTAAAGPGRLVRTLGLLTYTALAAYFAMPVSSFLLGKGVQLYHFDDRWLVFSSYAVLVFVLFLATGALDRVRRRLRRRGRRRRAFRLAEALLGMVTLLLSLQMLRAMDYGRPEGPVREDIPSYDQLPDYYDNFVALVRELESERWRDARVLGTLDHQLYVWWTAFEHKAMYVSDPCYSTIDDDETERRLLSFLQLVGARSEQIPLLVSDQGIHIFFLGCAKYQASKAHHYGPIEEYPPADQRVIREGPVTANWTLAIPRSELQRLRMRFQRVRLRDVPFASPDVIVLNASDRARGLEPPQKSYDRKYANGAFEVWKRR